MDVSGANRLRARTTARILRSGSPTLLNGHKTQGIWEAAQPNQVHLYLKDEEWERGVYTLLLAEDVRAAPFLVGDQSKAVRVNLGWNYVVRKVDVFEAAGVVIAVTCICVASMR